MFLFKTFLNFYYIEKQLMEISIYLHIYLYIHVYIYYIFKITYCLLLLITNKCIIYLINLLICVHLYLYKIEKSISK